MLQAMPTCNTHKCDECVAGVAPCCVCDRRARSDFCMLIGRQAPRAFVFSLAELLMSMQPASSADMQLDPAFWSVSHRAFLVSGPKRPRHNRKIKRVPLGSPLRCEEGDAGKETH